MPGMHITIELRLIVLFIVGLAFTYMAKPTVNEYKVYQHVYGEKAVERWCKLTEGGALAQGHLGPLFSIRCALHKQPGQDT